MAGRPDLADLCWTLGDRSGGGGPRGLDRAGLPGRAARRRCDRARVDERRARARPAACRRRRRADVFRRQRARGHCRRPRRTRSTLAGRSRAARSTSPRRRAASRTCRSAKSRSATSSWCGRAKSFRSMASSHRESATIDESALTGEPIPVVKARGAATFSGSLNAGETFEMAASSVAGESTYAGIVRLVTAAQTAKAPFVRLADRYALVFLPITLALAFIAWLISGDLIRSLAVLVAATPCPLISGGAGRLHRRRCPGGPARHPGQGRRPARSAGARPHRAVRQDRHADGRRRAASLRSRLRPARRPTRC